MEEPLDASLRKQFQALQEQQQKKLMKRKQRQESKATEDKNVKDTEKSRDLNASHNGFGIVDDMGLKLSEPIPQDSIFNEELNTHLNNQIRELKDENGRLYKLLSERDYEIRKLKKKHEEDRQALAGMGGGMANDTAATKIVDLSKKNRELTSELESEKTKVKQLIMKVREAEKAAAQTTSGRAQPVRQKQPSEIEAEARQKDFKETQDKLKDANSKLNEFRSQVATLKQELKIAHKVISKEIGDNVNIHSLLNENSNWRGRSQQVLLLQKKVEDLKSQLEQSRNLRPGTEMSLEDQFMTMDLPDEGASTALTTSTSFRSNKKMGNIDDRQKNRIRQMEKDRREAKDKAGDDLRALEEDYKKLKEKFEASKARNKVIANDLKSHKQRLATMVDKGKHDDELIEALLKQQTHLKTLLQENSKKEEDSMAQQSKMSLEMNVRTQCDANIVEQLKQIVAEKERKVHQLEQDLIEAQRNKMRSSLGYGDQHFSHQGRPPSQPGCPQSQQGRPPSQQGRPPSQQGRPPSQQGRPSSQQGRPSSQQGFSLSQDNSPSQGFLMSQPSSMIQMHQSVVNGTAPNIINGPVPPCRQSMRSNSRQGVRSLSRESHQAMNEMTKRVGSMSRNRPASTGSIVKGAISSEASGEVLRQFQEYKSLLQVAEVERDKVMELVKVLQQRVDEGSQKVTETNSAMVDLQQRNVHLEKQLGRLKVDSNKGRGKKIIENRTTIGALSSHEELLKDNLLISQENVDELQTRLAIQMDENNALKAALQSTMKAKEEDLKLYHQMMDQTKQVFLQGLRQYRQTNPPQ